MDIEEDIKILNEYINIDRKMRNNNQESDYDKFCERQCIAIENLLAEREEDKKRIKELEVLEDDLKDKRIVYVDTPEFEEKFIAKQKVKDKIEEIKEDKESKYFDKFLMTRDIDYAIEILEELLEDK